MPVAHGRGREGYIVDAAAGNTSTALPAAFVAWFQPAGSLTIERPEQALLQSGRRPCRALRATICGASCVRVFLAVGLVTKRSAG